MDWSRCAGKILHRTGVGIFVVVDSLLLWWRDSFECRQEQYCIYCLWARWSSCKCLPSDGLRVFRFFNNCVVFFVTYLPLPVRTTKKTNKKKMAFLMKIVWKWEMKRIFNHQLSLGLRCRCISVGCVAHCARAWNILKILQIYSVVERVQRNEKKMKWSNGGCWILHLDWAQRSNFCVTRYKHRASRTNEMCFGCTKRKRFYLKSPVAKMKDSAERRCK